MYTIFLRYQSRNLLDISIWKFKNTIDDLIVDNGYY